MVEGIEGIYQRIADGMLSTLPEEWTAARIETIFYPDSSEYMGEYISTSGRPISCHFASDTSRAFRELRQMFQDAGCPLWGQAAFDLWPDGKFNMNFGYEGCDENGDTIWDEEAWSRTQEQRQRKYTEWV